MQNTTNSSRSPVLIRLPSTPSFHVPSVADGISYLLLACTDSATPDLAILQLIESLNQPNQSYLEFTGTSAFLFGDNTLVGIHLPCLTFAAGAPHREISTEPLPPALPQRLHDTQIAIKQPNGNIAWQVLHQLNIPILGLVLPLPECLTATVEISPGLSMPVPAPPMGWELLHEATVLPPEYIASVLNAPLCTLLPCQDFFSVISPEIKVRASQLTRTQPYLDVEYTIHASPLSTTSFQWGGGMPGTASDLPQLLPLTLQSLHSQFAQLSVLRNILCAHYGSSSDALQCTLNPKENIATIHAQGCTIRWSDHSLHILTVEFVDNVQTLSSHTDASLGTETPDQTKKRIISLATQLQTCLQQQLAQMFQC